MSKPKSARAKKGLDPSTGIKDFSEDASDPIPFFAGLNPDKTEFTAVGDVAGGLFLDLADVAASDDTAKTVAAISEFFEDVLTEDCVEEFLSRLNDSQKPIPLPQALKIFEWLVQIYSGEAERPTQAASSSRGGSGSTGQSSTATARSQDTTPSEED